MVGVENRSGRWAHHHRHRQILQQTSRLGNVSESSGDKSRPDQRNDLHARRRCGGDCRRADRSQPLDKLGSYIVMLWLIGIAVNLVTTGMFYDLAMRDVEIAVCVCAVATDGGARTACNRTTGSKSGGEFAALINPVTPVIPRCQTSWHQVLSSPERRRIYDFAAQVGIVTWGTAQDIR